MQKCTRCKRMFDGYGARCDDCIEGKTVLTRKVDLTSIKSDAVITNFEKGNVELPGDRKAPLPLWSELEESSIEEQQTGNE